MRPPQVTPEKLEDMTPYPGVDYLGVGYDAVHGNPLGGSKTMKAGHMQTSPDAYSHGEWEGHAGCCLWQRCLSGRQRGRAAF